ncbi:MAG TPA: glycosyltransferase family 4 protein [Vicinamibacteria bacterium]
MALLSRAAYPLHPPGGMEKAVYHLASRLQERGVETVLVTRPPTRGEPFPGDVVTVPYGGRAEDHGRILDRTRRYPRFSARMGDAVAEMVKAGRVDLVDAQGLCALGYGQRRRADPALRAPLVMNPQGLEEHQTTGLKRLALTRLRALSREAARLSDRVIATDEATREDVHRLLGVEAGRVVVIPNGIEPAEVARLTPAEPAAVVHAARPALVGASPLFLSVGRLEGYKGFGDVLEALARLHRRSALPAPWAWAVAGEGPARRALERRARTELAGHVHFLGGVGAAMLHALYARADVFVHAPRYEGSSLVTLEAMAHGLPVVATRAGGIPDKVRDAETGRLVAPGDVDGLAAALHDLAADPSRRREMGRRGRERAEADFAWERIIERVLALYRSLL